ncbi:hypothetical protein TPA0907_63610 [Micromonospora humidisoli]|nr:hypothetical protein TPA0907_63610 [Micromonospora sp. AKA109]
MASGDPDHQGVVLWTRLAPQPLAEDGLGGMPGRTVEVQWEVAAADALFRHVVQRGTQTARPEAAHSVHVELTGLLPGREYFYRFRAEGHLSPPRAPGPRPTRRPCPPRWRWVSSPAPTTSRGTSPRTAAGRERAGADPAPRRLQYEYAREYGPDRPRGHEGPETRTLANYRQRHAQYKTDPDLQAAHAVAPWAVVFDDHEVENNWAGAVPEEPDPDFLARRAAAFQAYHENMPFAAVLGAARSGHRAVPAVALGSAGHLPPARHPAVPDDQACWDGYRDCPAAADPGRTITGNGAGAVAAGRVPAAPTPAGTCSPAGVLRRPGP